jgi:hypothetical protein
MIMHTGKWMIGCLAVLAYCGTAIAITEGTPDHPYKQITVRNLFALKDLPPIEVPAPIKPQPKIVLAGIIGGFGPTRALMRGTQPAKPGEQAREQSYTLAVGERDGDVEVVEINEKLRTVKVKVAGMEVPLNFVSTPSGGGNSGQTAPTAVAPAPMKPPALSAPTLPQPQPQAQPELSAEQATILLELERERLKMKNDSLHELMPPTELSPGAGGGTSPSPGGPIQAGPGGGSFQRRF